VREFHTWAIAPGVGGQFWVLPGFSRSKRKNVTTWTLGWLYFSLALVKLHKPPTI